MDLQRPDATSTIHLLRPGTRVRESAPPGVIDEAGNRLDLPDEVFEAVRIVVAALYSGMGVQIEPLMAEMNPVDADQTFGYQPGTTAGLIADGKLAFRDHNGRTTVSLADLMQHDQRLAEDRRAAFQSYLDERPEDE